LIPLLLAAQLVAASTPIPPELGVRPQASAEALSAAIVGGVLGSVVGLGAGLAIVGPQRCGQDDVGCIVSRLGIAGLFTVAGAAGGAFWGGRRVEPQPSALGAVLGAAAGAGLGLGLWKLLDEAGYGGDGWTAAVTFTVPQGVLAGVGTRLFR
jgi:hypothetical protein